MSSSDVMPDFTHGAVGNVPANGPYTHVAGYTSGTSGIVWTASDWEKYPNQVHIRIEQGYGGFTPNMADYDVLDIENGAWTPETAATEVKRRVEAGYVGTTLYAGDADLAATAVLIKAFGDAVWVGHVDCVLANWNLNQAQAGAIVGTEVHGMTCRAVQWASPSSNPNTVLPGTTLTLKQANVDLNVVQSSWKPVVVPRGTSNPPTVAPPAADPMLEFKSAGVVVWQAGTALHTREVVSQDGGKTWH
jgi:hypothetical protein